MNKRPLISIITVCLNRAEFIADAIESARRQDCGDIEHIVVDGGSTDGTLDVLSRYPDLRVVTEPDQGVYDAMNKGIRLARGEVVGLLNSDDVYEDNILDAVVSGFAEDPELDALVGGATVFEDEPDGACRIVATYSGIGQGDIWPHITHGVPIHNAWFFRRQLYERVGFYDTRYRFGADRDFLIRMAIAGGKHGELGRPVYRYRQHAGSLTVRSDNPRNRETLAEFLSVSEQHLTDPELPLEGRRACRRWHSRDAAILAFEAMRTGSVKDAVGWISRGWRYDPLWPARVAVLALSSCTRRLLVRSA